MPFGETPAQTRNGLGRDTGLGSERQSFSLM